MASFGFMKIHLCMGLAALYLTGVYCAATTSRDTTLERNPAALLALPPEPQRTFDCIHRTKDGTETINHTCADKKAHEAFWHVGCDLLHALQDECRFDKMTPEHRVRIENILAKQVELLTATFGWDKKSGHVHHRDTEDVDQHAWGEALFGKNFLDDDDKSNQIGALPGEEGNLPCATVAIWTCFGTVLAIFLSYGVVAHFRNLKEDCTSGGHEHDHDESPITDTFPAIGKDNPAII